MKGKSPDICGLTLALRSKLMAILSWGRGGTISHLETGKSRSVVENSDMKFIEIYDGLFIIAAKIVKSIYV